MSITHQNLPAADEMYQALVNRDSQYEGVFFVAVKTTGIFCRPTCPAKKPLQKNVLFFPGARDALAAGFRPCRRCRPMNSLGAAPDWLTPLLDRVDEDPNIRWTDWDLKQQGIQPSRVRRWFKKHHGMTFHSYQRTRRLAAALGQIHVQNQPATVAAFDHGYESLSGFREAFQQLFGELPSQKKATVASVNRILTPLGPMIGVANETHILLLEFADRKMLATQIQRLQNRLHCTFVPAENELLRQLMSELGDYFSGRRQQFTVPVNLQGTEFQTRVWSQLLKIPCGQTSNYELIARQIGHLGAQRAVGRANGDNRLAIVVPCHRVVRSNGTLCGYGGGLWRKQWLLDHEKKMINSKP